MIVRIIRRILGISTETDRIIEDTMNMIKKKQEDKLAKALKETKPISCLPSSFTVYLTLSNQLATDSTCFWILHYKGGQYYLSEDVNPRNLTVQYGSNYYIAKENLSKEEMLDKLVTLVVALDKTLAYY